MPGYLDTKSNITFGWADAENDWGGPTNRSLRQLAYAGIHPTVKNTTTSTPPTSPTLGDKYIVAPGPSGAWASYNANDIAVWGRGLLTPATPAWQRFIPMTGWQMYNEADNTLLAYNGTSWAGISGSGGGASVQANWAQTDTTAADYIQNKPFIDTPIWGDASAFNFTQTLTAGIGVTGIRMGSFTLNPIGSRLPGSAGYGVRINIDGSQTYTLPSNTIISYTIIRPNGTNLSINNRAPTDPRDDLFISTVPSGGGARGLSSFSVAFDMTSNTGGAVNVTFNMTAGPKIDA